MRTTLKKALSMLLALIMMIGLVPVSAYASEDVGEEVCTHLWDAGVTAAEASCTEEGSIVFTCELCGETKTEALSALGHAWGEWTDEVAPTCTKAGEHTHACTREGCDAVETVAIPALGHDWGEWTDEVAPDCTEAGSHTHVCARCALEETVAIEALGHDWGEWTDEVAPNCTEAGSHKHVCRREGCAFEETVAIPALGHDWGEWTDEVAPDCTEAGSHKHACTVCGETETVAIDALGHDWGADNGLDPVTCTVCGELKLIAEGGEYDLEIDGDYWILAGDPNADVETAALWDAMFADFERTGRWAEDLLAVARTQLDYRESARNYVMNIERVRQGYSRYGAWYGIPYGDWCAMFISFCLHYAEIPAEAMPREAGCAAWISALNENGLYVGAGEYRPKAGDLIFYDEKGDGEPDHVGIVASYDAGSGVIGTIEGNLNDAVAARELGVSDDSIVGYGLLPEQTAADTREQRTITASFGDQTVTVKGMLPADAELVVVAVPAETAAAVYEKQTGEKADDGLLACDISIISGGKEYEPEDFDDSVRVTVSNTGATEESLDVLHVKVNVTDGQGGLDQEKLNSLLTEEAEKEFLSATAADGTVAFETASFTVFFIPVTASRGGSMIHVTGSWPAADADTYVMGETNQKGFAVNYAADTTENVVMVVECLDFGATFAALPSTSTDVTEVKKLDNSHVALRLQNSAAPVNLDISFTMEHTVLTNAQAQSLIDDYANQTARIAGTLYHYTGALDDVLTAGTKIDEDVLWTGKPVYNSSPDIHLMTGTVPNNYTGHVGEVYEQSYIFSVSPVSSSTTSVTNYMLKAAGWYQYETLYGPYCNGAMRVRLPAAYDADGSLLEIAKIRVYEPTDLVRLTSINQAIWYKYYACAADMGTSDYEQNFGRYNNGSYGGQAESPYNWSIATERTLDPDTGKYYYEITPPTRWFNVNSRDKTDFRAVLPFIWQLADPDVPLTPDTLYTAENTQIFYKLPGDTDTRVASVTGPRIHVYALEERPIKHHFNPIRALSHNYEWDTSATAPELNGSSRYLSDENVIVGGIYRDEYFSRVYNSGYHLPSASTAYVPANTGAITQTYDFPYQIQPRKIYLRESSQGTLNMDPDNKSTLTAITWTTWDGQTGSADQAAIDAANEALRAEQINSRGVPQGYYNNESAHLLLSYSFPEGLEIKSVSVAWSQLSTITRYHVAGESYTVQTSFDYKVNGSAGYGDSTPLGEYTRVHAVYTETYGDGSTWTLPEDARNIHYDAGAYAAGDTRNGPQYGQKYLWFRLKQELDPDLYGEGTKGSDSRYIISKWLSSGDTDNVGNVGFLVDQYGMRRDYIHNPVISLRMKYGLYSGDVTTNGITPEQGVAFLTGKFTATKEASGWYFRYTTLNNSAEQTFTIPNLTADTEVQIPLDDGDYFTSLKLCYDGEADLSHEDENDTRTIIWLMKDIEIRLMDVNPITGERIVTAEDYRRSDMSVDGTVTYTITGLTREGSDGQQVPTCGCWFSGNTEPHVVGQDMLRNMNGNYARLVGSFYYSTRRGYVSVRIHEPSTDNNPILRDIVQGGSVTNRWDFWGAYGTSSYSPSNDYNMFANDAGEVVFPWLNIGEAMYIELTDPEFVFVPENSSIFGYPVTGAGVTWDVVTAAGGERFLKIVFDKDFQRMKVAWDCGWYTGNWTSVWYATDNSYGANWNRYPGSFYSQNNRVSAWGGLELSFRSLPGTAIGDHHPIGTIYLDASGMAENYCASVDQPIDEMTGYDYDRTKYELTRAKNSNGSYMADAMYVVPDNYGLSSTAIGGDKLFAWDCSAYTVHVDISLQAGAELAPGKSSTYDFEPRVTTYYPTEENKLNGLLTVKGPGNPNSSSIYDMDTYVILPRIGTPIRWAETVETESGTTLVYHIQDNTELNIYLRGPVAVISNTDNQAYSIAYTSETNPSASSDYSYDPTASGNSWDAVTGFRLSMPEVKTRSAVNLRLDLRSDQKTTIDVLTGYAGGTFAYAATPGGTLCDPVCLPLSAWVYENIQITSGRVFWDMLDENGARNGNNNTEPYINGVVLKLYDANDTLIDTKTTANSQGGTNANDDGVFPALQTYKVDAGQYIVIEDPAVTDGSTVKLTKKSSSGPMVSDKDSDFDRDTHRLTLGALSVNGVNNISAGFVKLPKIAVSDVELLVGETKEMTALIDEFVTNNNYNASTNILINGGYKLQYSGVDASIARLNGTPALERRNGNSTTQLVEVFEFTGVAPGRCTVTATLTNSLGDEVTATFEIIVNDFEDIIVNKVWDDNNDQDGMRPASVELQLMQKIGSAAAASYGEAVTLSATGTDGAWQEADLTHTWEDVPKYDDNGDEIVYSVVETAIPAPTGHATGYTASYEKSEYDATNKCYTITVTNAHTPEKVSKTVAKVWNDNNNQDGKRPTSLSVQLKADGTAVAGKTVTLNVSNEWTGTIEGLDKYAAGTAIVYSWDEGTITDYTLSSTSVSGDTTTLTNLHTPETKRITVTKVWADRNNVDRIRPGSVAFTVTGSDGKTYSVPLSGSGNTWSAEVEVTKFWNHGTLVTFTVDEPNVPAGYTKSVSGLTVTNRHEPNVTITYKLNGGRYPYMGSTDDIIEVYPKGSTITIHARPYRTGYVFLYWQGSVHYPGDSYVANEDHVFVAQWQRRNPWSPATGDNTPWLPWLGVLLLSGAALGADALIRKRKRGKDEK